MYTILHVETSKFYRTFMKNICIDLEMQYESASDMKNALKVLDNTNIDLIITAMEITDGSAKDLITEINKSKYKNIPIVVITGNDSYEDRKSMYDLGIVDYIIKQANPDELKKCIKTYIKDDEIISKMAELSIATLDDSSVERFIIKRIFTMYNISKVDYYKSGQELLDCSNKYDIYLVDLVLEKMSGRSVISQLRSRDPDCVIISISGVDNPKVISSVLTAGADDYITKPFNNELFISRLKTNVRNYLLLKEVERMAITDGLTQLYNHKYMMEQLKNKISSVKRYKEELSLIMLDLDLFKNINDKYGHQFGDEVLRSVSKIIKDTVRESDLPGRYGGEEFIIILPNTDSTNAKGLAERIRKKVELWKNKNNYVVTISAGVKQYKDENLDEFIKNYR